MAKDPADIMSNLHVLEGAVVRLIETASAAVSVLAEGLDPEKAEVENSDIVDEREDKIVKQLGTTFELLVTLRDYFRQTFDTLTAMAIPPDLSMPNRMNLYAEEKRLELQVRKVTYVRRSVHDLISLLEKARDDGVFREVSSEQERDDEAMET